MKISKTNLKAVKSNSLLESSDRCSLMDFDGKACQQKAERGKESEKLKFYRSFSLTWHLARGKASANENMLTASLTG